MVGLAAAAAAFLTSATAHMATVAPALIAWVIGSVFAGRLAIEDGMMILERLGQRVEIPCASIRRLAPWTLPLPAGNGRRFPC